MQKTLFPNNESLLTVESRRQGIFAALLRYAPETGSLRDRVLDQLILIALYGTSEDEPLRIGGIQANLRVDDNSGVLRTEIIQDVLARLQTQNKVCQTELKKRHAYYLSANGQEVVGLAATTAAELFAPVLKSMLANVSSTCDPNTAESVCRAFVSRAFASAGQQIARLVTGEISSAELIEQIDARRIFASVASNYKLSAGALESLEARCLGFLRSTDINDERLKFRLTQGYYVAQLLGLENSDFNPIADEAFRGAILYIDTNVLLASIIPSESTSSLEELVRISRGLGIELRVTRATLNELRKVTIDRKDELSAVVEKLPHELAERTRDDLLEGYFFERRENPDLTPSEYLDSFALSQGDLEKLGIVFDDRDVDDILEGVNVANECRIIDESAIERRGWGKSESVQRHDACHYHAVREERLRGSKAWFLTKDATLQCAAVALDKGQLPFCFPLIGFLQAISPFLETSAEDALVGMFTSALDSSIHAYTTSDNLFDLQELRLISEMHEDVLATPPDQLVLAFDYVKGKVLDGEPYREASTPKVALELKKFLASSVEEKQRALRDEALRQQRISESERNRRLALESEKSKSEKAFAALQSGLDSALLTQKGLRSEILVFRCVIMGMGLLLALAMWGTDDVISTMFTTRFPNLNLSQDHAEMLLRVAGSIIFLCTSLPVVLVFSKGYRIAILSVIAAVAGAQTELLKSQSVSEVADWLAIGGPIALVALLLLDKGRTMS
ncbi:hypothetical protein [Haloferula sp. A504]|uniref:hypothetical protein n=1 Tax=Haloferula sp. A504 TaxID=3373601 RepID=UPI0031C83E26|nr:hypothetical protein [Verrucomicrobiaceae bacterium E54]